MRNLGFIVLVLFISQFSMADRLNEVVLGVLRQSSAQNYITGEKTGVRPGFGLGLKAESFDYSGFSLKIGLMIEQRHLTDIFGGVEHNITLTHADLLTHVAYKVTDSFSIFAGPQYSVLMSTKCKPALGDCLLSESHASKYFIPVEAGLDFTFMENYGVEAYYEWISQEIWETTFEKIQTYGLNLKYKF